MTTVDPAGHDLCAWIDSVVIAGIERHALGAPGAYARTTRMATATGPDPYGCADAANLLYTVGRFPRHDREAWIAILQGLQDPDTGLFCEATHDPIHTTAHCLAALELFEAGPLHPLSGLAELRDPAAMEAYLDGLAWSTNPWIEAHRGAGLYAALVLADAVPPVWGERWAGWVVRESDPGTGLLRRGCVPSLAEKGEWVFPHLAGTFHYLFDLHHAQRPIPHAAALVDTCLEIFARHLFPLGESVGFAEIDWVYCLARAAEQSGHRIPEAHAALDAFIATYLPYLLALDPVSDDGLDDLHRLFGAVCALAELQRVLPGRIRTRQPLRLVLDRRPFI